MRFDYQLARLPNTEAAPDEVEAASRGHRGRSQHRCLNLREQVLLQYAGHIDRCSVYEYASSALLTPVHEVGLVAAHDEFEIELQALRSPRNVFEFRRR